LQGVQEVVNPNPLTFPAKIRIAAAAATATAISLGLAATGAAKAVQACATCVVANIVSASVQQATSLGNDLTTGDPFDRGRTFGSVLGNVAAIAIPAAKGVSAIRLGGAVRAAEGASSASSAVNGVRLSQQLARNEAASIFTDSGGLKQSVIDRSDLIIRGNDLGNPALREALTQDGSSLSDWGKYQTPTYRSPSGPFSVHFYYNPATGESYFGMDYKAIFGGNP
jgi:hypothetical protein